MQAHRQVICCVVIAINLVLAACAANQALAQSGEFVDHVYTDESGDHKYVVFVPRGYDPAKKWPVILYLHDAAQRGSDGLRQTQFGLGPAVKQRSDSFPFFVVFPQAEDERGRRLTGWSPDSRDGKRAMEILDAVEQQYSVDTRHEILTGWSMGGYGVWSLAAAAPERFSALVPLAGGGEENQAARLKDVPIWAWHGARDTAVFPAEANRMVESVRAVGGQPLYTEVPNIGHDVWRVAYASEALYRWMLEPTKPPATSQIAKDALYIADSEPFIPALTISSAIHVRLGNQVLQALSYSIPARVPRSALQGSIRDIYQTTTASGRTFRVALSGVTYEAQLVRAALKAWRKDRLNIQLGLRNVVLTIRSSSMVGSGRSAVTGPIYIVIGNRRPVWLNMDVTPFVADGKLKLRLVAANFPIPNDNWYVTPPSGIRTSGFGMTRERVSSGLVSGLYGSKSRIESEVVAAIPAMLRELEENLDLSPVNDVAASFWPLPVYQPRLRARPESVSTDENGISLVMGITAAAIDVGHEPEAPRAVSLSQMSSNLPSEEAQELRVGLNPEMLGPLIDLLRDADVARIHVLDIPENTFADFADRDLLSRAVPDLKGLGADVEILSELVLDSSLEATPAQTGVSDSAVARVEGPTDAPTSPNGNHAASSAGKVIEKPTAMRFEIPQATISLSVRSGTQKDWSPYVDFEFRVAQTAVASVNRPTFTTRSLRLDWTGEPEFDVSARFAADYQPADATLNTTVIREMLSRSWQAWTSVGPVADVALADVDLGSSKMRAGGLEWRGQELSMPFAAAGIRITNDSQESLVYEIQGPYSGWGGPYTLEPSDYHQFEVPYPVSFRQSTPSGSRFTLPAGSHSEYRTVDSQAPPRLFKAREQPLQARDSSAVGGSVAAEPAAP